MKENGEIDPEEDLPYTTAITVTGDTIAAVHQLKEQSDEETTKEGARLVRADFEGELSMGCLKAYLDQLIEAGANKDGIKLTLQYLNADGTVLYESAFTYADLAAAVNPAA